jgi:predicted  nucleic acid-binding Zn-ribbon protein
MNEHEQKIKKLNDKMVDLQNDFITKISKQVLQNMKDIKLLEDRVAKLENDNSFDLQELKKEFGGYKNE